jgi:hypothetical protein
MSRFGTTAPELASTTRRANRRATHLPRRSPRRMPICRLWARSRSPRNRAKVRALNVERVVADVFDWDPPTDADLVMFGFLLSHVPRSRFAAFWTAVGEMLGPAGRVFVVDESQHDLWQEELVRDAASEVIQRTLIDGRTFHIVKVHWDPIVLASKLEGLGWRSHFVRRDPFYGGTVVQVSHT